MLPRNFQLDHQLRFTQIEGEPQAIRLGEPLRSHCDVALWDVVYDALGQAITTRTRVTLEAEFPDEGRQLVEILPLHEAIIVTIRPKVVFSQGNADEFFRKAADMLCLLDLAKGLLVRANPTWHAALGYADESLDRRNLFELIPDEDRLEVTAALAQAAQGVSARFACRFLAASGEFHYLQWSVAPGKDGGPAYGASRDITQTRAVELEVRRQTHRDTLTDLPNRKAIEEAILKLLTSGAHGAFGVLVLALDRFKWVNEALGQDGGDQALMIIARRLGAALRAEDVIGRLEGDTFVALLPGVAGEGDAHSVAQKVLEAVQTPFALRGLDIRLTACIGLALAPFHGTDPRTLLERADTAMYQAKKASRGHVTLWRDGMTLTGIERLALESRLSQAVDRGEMLLHYQPQVAAGSGHLLGFEALARWNHQQLGMIPPDTFIPMAEDSGLIVPLGEWVMKEAFGQAAFWQRALSGLGVSVNLSGRQLSQNGLTSQIEELLAMSGVNREHVDLEITETDLMHQDEAKVKDVLFKIKDMGLQLSVDDFGMGYTNFGRLAKLPVDRIKIDRSFITHICESPADEAVVRAMVDISRTLGMKVVAEGVETQAQFEKLTQMGCDIIQGYLFGKPLAAADVPRLLTAR